MGASSCSAVQAGRAWVQRAVLALLSLAALLVASTATAQAADQAQAAVKPASYPVTGIADAAHRDHATHASLPRSTLMPGEILSEGEWLTSENGRYRLELQHDGNLVLSDIRGPTVLWETGTAGESQRTLIMQHTGDLVIFKMPFGPFQLPWQARTHGWPGAFLTVQDDGNITVGYADGHVLWKAGADKPDVGLDGVQHIVYERSGQRVWLIEADGTVMDNYPVSGKQNSPVPGRHRVFSKSMKAWSYVPGVTMAHMVRFARTSGGSNIGFHAIPVSRGAPIQTNEELGQFRSAGCVRQRDDKAVQLYKWAPIGTPVVVLA